MKILGIDPGLERVGFGLIERREARVYSAIDWGVITTKKQEADAQRLKGIYDAMLSLLDETKPDQASIEKLFFFRNATTMGPVSQARGVILLALYTKGVPYMEYTPMQVKMTMTGYGKSDKKEVQQMVQTILAMDELPKPDDAADALALALCASYEAAVNPLLSRVD